MTALPTERTLIRCRRLGHVAAVAEHWNHYAKIRVDLYSWIDIVVLEPETRTIVGLQVTTAANIAARIAKIRAEPKAKLWAECGGRIEVHGWSKRKPPGKKRWLWKLRRVVLGVDGLILVDEVEE